MWFVMAAAIAAGMWCASIASAQTMQEQGMRPVDQMVSDIDPTQVSLRQQDAGLSTIGERQNVYRRIVPDAGPYQPGNQRLYYVSYGVVAEFDRSEYGVIRDKNSDLNGAILQFIPPNTVFHIGLPRAPHPQVDPNVQLPGMVDGRVDGMVQGDPTANRNVTGRLINPSQSRRVDSDANQTQRYQELVVAQRGLVVAAIGRIAKSTSP